MTKITGIKSVDFKIIAKGHGVVNWNGPTSLKGNGGKTTENHSLPKLRGYTNLNGKSKEENNYKYRKEPIDIDFKETPMYISQNCIRHHLFKDQNYDLHYATNKNVDKVLASITGLIRGYMLPASQCKRTSPLLIEDFVDQLGNGNFEQMGKSGTKEKIETKSGKDKSACFYSKTTFGDTEYISYGSINIENLQFISLDNKFNKASMIIKKGEGKKIALKIKNFIQSLNSKLKPDAVFHLNYVRQGTIFEEGEIGILLNNDAIKALVNHTLDMISNLSIQQSKSYMFVNNIEVDYNDSYKMMRIKHNKREMVEKQNKAYAIYYKGKS